MEKQILLHLYSENSLANRKNGENKYFYWRDEH